eukprot:scaffold185504_cov55-Attheya_sp.AAC.2
MLGEQEDIKRTMDKLLSPVWTYELPVVRCMDGAIVNISNPPPTMNAWMRSTWKCNSKITLELLSMARMHLLSKSTRVALHLPRDGPIMCPFTVVQMYLEDPIIAIENIQVDMGQFPAFISLGEVVNGRRDIDEMTVPKIVDEWRTSELQYYCVARHLVMTYAGEVANNTSSELQATKQMQMINGKMVMDDLNQYFQRFSEMLDLFDFTMPFPLPIATTFREGMIETLK